MIENEIHKQMRKKRTSEKLSQRELCEMAGVQQAQLSKIENGESDPRLNTLLNISRCLGLELMVIPNEFVPIVNSIVHNTGEQSRPMYDIEEE